MDASNKTLVQASVIPFRFKERGLEFCLITTRRSGRWGFPKGTVASGKTAESTALSEAFEEAGLQGEVVGKAVGEYSYKKNGRKHSVVVLLMSVAQSGKQWKEAHERERRWAPLDDARQLLDRPNLLQLLEQAAEQINSSLDAADGAA